MILIYYDGKSVRMLLDQLHSHTPLRNLNMPGVVRRSNSSIYRVFKFLLALTELNKLMFVD